MLFVGAFRPTAADGTVGGQTVVCRRLCDSPIAAHVDWVLVDCTQPSLPHPPWWQRALSAVSRLVAFAWRLRTVDAVLILSPVLLASIAEKGVMALVAHWAGRTVVLSLRSEIPTADRGGLLPRMLRVVLKRCDTVWVQSAASKTAAGAFGVEDAKVVVIPNFVNAAQMAEAGDGWRAGVQPAFVYAGWFTPGKGVIDLVDAFAKIAGDLPQATLALYGGGPERDRIARRVHEHGLDDRVTFMGWVRPDRLAAVLRHATALVLPSYTEGMPNSVLDSLAAGTPAIATAVGAIPDLVAHGENGYLCAPGDVDGLARHMARLASDDGTRRAMGERARQTVMERFLDTRWWPVILRRLHGDSTPAAEDLEKAI